MDIQKEVDARVKAVLGDIHVQLIIALTNFEAAQARIKELEAQLSEPVRNAND